MKQEELIQTALEQIISVWQADATSLRHRDPQGFDWLPGSHLVRVRAAEAEQEDLDETVLGTMGGASPRPGGIRLSVTTKLLLNFPNYDRRAVEILNSLAPSLSSTYSLVYPSHELIKILEATDRSCDLELFSSIYIDENLVGWLPKFFAQMSIMQPIDAEVRGYRLPIIIGGGQPSFELGYKNTELDGILEVADQVFAPAGARPSRWNGSDEFERFAQTYGRAEGCIANGDTTSLTAEVPFGKDTALIRCWTNQAHPQLGSGLLVTLQLPYSDAAPDGGAAYLNFLEACTWTEVPQFGCWHSRNTGAGRGITLSHSCFIPNALYRPGLVQNFVLWQTARARWARHILTPGLQDKMMSEIYSARKNQ